MDLLPAIARSPAGVDAAPAIPDRARIAESADAQASSTFFASLPLEIRKMIYAEFWRLDGAGAPNDGLCQHIVREPHGRGMGHFACLLDHRSGPKPTRDTDEGFHAGCRSVAASEAVTWENGVMTDWGLHWPCQKQLQKAHEADGAADAEQQDCADPACSAYHTWSPFMPAMLTCKRFYLECSESIYDVVTFHLTDTAQAADFLGSRLAAGLLCRSVEISLRVTPLLTELYLTGEKASVAGRPPVTASNNPWQRLCDVLVRASHVRRGGLREVRIWLDSSDLRPWHRRVLETHFLGRLLDCKKPMGEFLIDLPLIPDEVEKRGLPLGCYLEDAPREMLPFQFVRNKRTNNWMTHINRMSHLRFSSQRP